MVLPSPLEFIGAIVLRNSSAGRVGFIIIMAIAVIRIAYFVFAYLPYSVNAYNDFVSFYTAGKIVDAGAPDKLYDSARQWEIQKWCCAVPIRTNGPLPFTHAPAEALLFAPLAPLGYGAAYLSWTSLNILMLLLISFGLRDYGSAIVPHWSLLAAVAFAFFPCFIAIAQGQDSILLTCIYTLVFLSFKSGRPFAAGAFLGIGTLKPQLVVPFAAILLIRRQWRAALGFVVAAGVVAALAMAFIGPGSMVAYIKFLLAFPRLPVNVSGADPAAMANLRGLSVMLLGRIASPRVITGIVVFLSAAVVCIAAWLWRGNLERDFSIAMVASLLASYHLIVHDLTLLFLPLVLVFGRLTPERNKPAAAGLIASTVPWFLMELFSYLPVHAIAAISLALLLGFGASLCLIRTDTARATHP